MEREIKWFIVMILIYYSHVGHLLLNVYWSPKISSDDINIIQTISIRQIEYVV